jgi:hypothetical protein
MTADGFSTFLMSRGYIKKIMYYDNWDE